MTDDLRAELAARNAEHDPIQWIACTEDWARELANGRVPEEVQSMARQLVDQVYNLIRRTAERDAEDRQRMEKPRRRKKGQAA